MCFIPYFFSDTNSISRNSNLSNCIPRSAYQTELGVSALVS